MRVGGVLQDPVPEPADQVRQAAPPPPLPPHRLRLRHRAALLRPPRRQDAHRDFDQGHAALRVELPVAVNVDSRLQHVTQRPPASSLRDVCLMSAPLVANSPTTKTPNSQPDPTQVGVTDLFIWSGENRQFESWSQQSWESGAWRRRGGKPLQANQRCTSHMRKR